MSCVRSASGILSRRLFSERAALASVVPVSPSPDFASSSLSLPSAAVNKSQIASIVARVRSSAEAIGCTGVSPSGRRSILGWHSDCMPGQASGATGNLRPASCSSERRSTDTEKPCMSSEVISAAGPIINLIWPETGELASSWASTDISSGVVEPRLLSNATRGPAPRCGCSFSSTLRIASRAPLKRTCSLPASP